jgi:hypothetical protein
MRATSCVLARERFARSTCPARARGKQLRSVACGGGNVTSIRRARARGSAAMWERCLGVIARRWGWGTRLPGATCDLYAGYCGGTTLRKRYARVDANGAGQVLTVKMRLSRLSTCMNALNDRNRNWVMPNSWQGLFNFEHVLL